MNTYNWVATILLLGGIQGIIFIIAINKLKHSNRSANQLLSVFIGLVAFTLIGKIMYHPTFLSRYPYLTVFSDIIIFLYGPFLYLYIKQLLQPKQVLRIKHIWGHFVPALLFVILCALQLAFIPTKTYAILANQAYSFVSLFWLISFKFVVVQSIFYIVKSYRQIYAYKRQACQQLSYEEKIKYLKVVLGLVSVCIALWVVADVLLYLQVSSILLYQAYNIVWVLVAFITYVLGYYAMARPEIFSLSPASTPNPPPVKPSATKYANSSVSHNQIAALKQKLEECMTHQKPFLQPNLTAAMLAQMLMTNTTALSRVINECYHKNFFGFINTYRIQEFVALASQEKFQHYTYLALAYEVGFNSKSTFNKAFKMVHEMTPREYFKKTPNTANIPKG